MALAPLAPALRRDPGSHARVERQLRSLTTVGRPKLDSSWGGRAVVDHDRGAPPRRGAFPCLSSRTFQAVDERDGVAPQLGTFPTFVWRQLALRGRVRSPARSGSSSQCGQRPPSLDAIRFRAGVQLLGPGGQVSRNQSRACLDPGRRGSREPGRVVAMTAAGQGGGAGGVEPATGEVLGQLGRGWQRVDIEASGRGVVLLDEQSRAASRNSSAAGLSLPRTMSARRPSRTSR